MKGFSNVSRAATCASGVIPECFSRESVVAKRRDSVQQPYGMTFAWGGRIANIFRMATAGFTLIELLVVVLIIGILSAVAVPQYEKAVEKSRATQAFTLLKSLYAAQASYYMANGRYATSFDDLDVEIPWTGNEKWYTADTMDTRSNQDWSLQISGNATAFYLGRLRGPYKGAGWSIGLGTSSSWADSEMYCVERISAGVVFTNTPGSYCANIFSGKNPTTRGGLRIYSL